jgi:hypothetical protein
VAVPLEERGSEATQWKQRTRMKTRMKMTRRRRKITTMRTMVEVKAKKADVEIDRK